MILLPCLLLAASVVAAHAFSGAALDHEINLAIAEGRMPGAVLVVGHNGRIVYEKAYGHRATVPMVEPMTEDTIFDCASLTKVVATTSCLMKLYEEGRFRLNDPVTEYIPEFQNGKSPITIRNLMTHFSGLKPDVPLTPRWSGYEFGIALACTDPPEAPPGRDHIYSDINFELLGELVHRLSGQTLDVYARQKVFLPLDMKDTMFNPPPSLLPRIAPTEIDPDTGKPLLGVVHDPTARYMGGVAGHAGVFSTANDLSKFAQMMLNGGELGGTRIVSALTVKKFTEPQTPPDQPILRGLGWDIDSPYSSNRGELFPIGSYGHTGFTGTSIWIDPYSKSYVILLANSVHPHGGKSIVGLRARVATIAAASLGISAPRVALTGYNELVAGAGLRRPIFRNAHTMTGLDVLEQAGFTLLKGKKVGLITNQSGLDRQGRRNIDVMRAAGVDIRTLFSPEHGFASLVDHPGIGDAVDPATGIKIYSLYGDVYQPTPAMLEGLDALVYDIQDVGTRFYTYETTLGYCLEAAAKAHLRFIVLDRPNPITGTRVEGPLLDSANTSFVGYLAGTPARHGMTMGEMARMFNEEKHLGADLDVVPMRDWERGDWFDSLDLMWTNPSPNLRSLKACCLYPGVCFLEFPENFSVGRGTDSPFEQVGADFVNGRELADYLNRQDLPGVRVYPTRFTPTTSRFEGKTIEGVRFEIVDRTHVDASQIGIELACALQHLYPGKIDWSKGKRLIGSDDVIRRIEAGEPAYIIQDSFQEAVKEFTKRREKYLLYK